MNPSNISYGDDSFDQRKIDTQVEVSRGDLDSVPIVVIDNEGNPTKTRKDSQSVEADTIKINFNEIYLGNQPQKAV